MNKLIKQPEINLVNQCYERIQNYIIEGTLKPGKKLKVKDLKELLHSGHSPIREALSRLTESGLVQAVDNKGFRVSSISEYDIHDIYHTFLQIELLAIEQAIKHGNDAWKTTIVATLYNLFLIETSDTTPSIEEWIKRNYEFHYALISGCNSLALLDVRSHIYRKFDRYCRLSFKATEKQLPLNHEEHKKLADAVLNRDITTARTIMTRHILGSLEDVIHALKRHNLF